MSNSNIFDTRVLFENCYKLRESRMGSEPESFSGFGLLFVFLIVGASSLLSDSIFVSCSLLLVSSSLFRSRDGTNSFSLSSSPVFFIISHRRLVREGNSKPIMVLASIRGCNTYKQKKELIRGLQYRKTTKNRSHTVTPASTLRSVSSSGSHASLQIPVAASVTTRGH